MTGKWFLDILLLAEMLIAFYFAMKLSEALKAKTLVWLDRWRRRIDAKERNQNDNR